MEVDWKFKESEGDNLDCLLGTLSDPFHVHVTKLKLLDSLLQDVCNSASFCQDLRGSTNNLD